MVKGLNGTQRTPELRSMRAAFNKNVARCLGICELPDL